MCNVCAQTAASGEFHVSCQCGAPETFQAMQRISADLSRRQMVGGAAGVLGMFAGFGLAPQLKAQTPGRPLLLTNLRLFDGERLSIQSGLDILVQNGRIAALMPAGQGPADAEPIDCGGRTIIPGLIDSHWHTTLVPMTLAMALSQEPAFLHLLAAREAGATLMRGFTTVRDVGGPAFALKMAIDRGVVAGPRIYPSGAIVSQSSGHGDFRTVNNLPMMPRDAPDPASAFGLSALADGEAEVLRRTREQLMRGATQIKIAAGGGVSSQFDPLDSVQFTDEEIRAAVRAAADWGTYVCAHVYMPVGIQRCIRNGVKSIEHGQLADETSVKMMADNGVWWSIQPFLADEDANKYTEQKAINAQKLVAEGTVKAFGMARAHKVNWVFGTDILFGGSGASQGRQLAKLTRFMPPLEVLHHATGKAGQLLALSGKRNPYDGRLGVVAPGACADLLLVEGDPSATLDWLGDTANLRLIMKDGNIHKRDLPAA